MRDKLIQLVAAKPVAAQILQLATSRFAKCRSLGALSWHPASFVRTSSGGTCGWLCSVSAPSSLPHTAKRQSGYSTRWPFSSIGRINVVTGGNSTAHCTGTLIGPRHVLTAAHCLFNPMRDRWAHPSSFHFLAGSSLSEYKAHSRALAYVKGAVDVFTFPIRPASAALGLGDLIAFRRHKFQTIEILAAASPINDSTHIIRARYRYDRAHVLTVQQDC